MGQFHWLKELYDAHFRAVYSLVSYKLHMYAGSAADAQDIVQEVFLLAYQKDIRNHPNPAGWLMQTANHLCKNHVRACSRQEQKRRRAADELPKCTGEAAIREVDTKLTLESAIPSDDYEIIVKHYIFGQSLEDIARQMGISHAALRVRLYRIRKKLKDFFPDM